jgi:hypothetical protein
MLKFILSIFVLCSVLVADEFYNWGYNKVGAKKVWDNYTQTKLKSFKSDVVVGVIDNGFAKDVNGKITFHPDMVDNIWINENEIPNNGIDDDNNGYIDDVYGVLSDQHGKLNEANTIYGSHGSTVSSIIAAKTGNKSGIEGISNNQFKTVLCDYSVFSRSECIDYFIWLKKSGINIVAINNSYHQNYDIETKTAIKRAIEANILFVVSSGNNSSDNDEKAVYPSSYDFDGILSVGSSNKNNKLAKHSNYGKKSVDILAPGEYVYTLLIDKILAHDVGTSFAAPIVTAVAGYLHVYAQYLNENENYNIDLSDPVCVKDIILSSSKKFDHLKDITVSSGRVDMLSAVQTLDNNSHLDIKVDELNPNIGQEISFDFGLKKLCEDVEFSEDEIYSISWFNKTDNIELSDQKSFNYAFNATGKKEMELRVTKSDGMVAKKSFEINVNVELIKKLDITDIKYFNIDYENLEFSSFDIFKNANKVLVSDNKQYAYILNDKYFKVVRINDDSFDTIYSTDDISYITNMFFAKDNKYIIFYSEYTDSKVRYFDTSSIDNGIQYISISYNILEDRFMKDYHDDISIVQSISPDGKYLFINGSTRAKIVSMVVDIYNLEELYTYVEPINTNEDDNFVDPSNNSILKPMHNAQFSQDNKYIFISNKNQLGFSIYTTNDMSKLVKVKDFYDILEEDIIAFNVKDDILFILTETKLYSIDVSNVSDMVNPKPAQLFSFPKQEVANKELVLNKDKTRLAISSDQRAYIFSTDNMQKDRLQTQLDILKAERKELQSQKNELIYQESVAIHAQLPYQLAVNKKQKAVNAAQKAVSEAQSLVDSLSRTVTSKLSTYTNEKLLHSRSITSYNNAVRAYNVKARLANKYRSKLLSYKRSLKYYRGKYQKARWGFVRNYYIRKYNGYVRKYNSAISKYYSYRYQASRLYGPVITTRSTKNKAANRKTKAQSDYNTAVTNLNNAEAKLGTANTNLSVQQGRLYSAQRELANAQKNYKDAKAATKKISDQIVPIDNKINELKKKIKELE